MSKTTFTCEQCGKEKTEPTCWYKKRAHHFCSRECGNRFKAAKVSLGMSRKEYEKEYWSRPENKERRKAMSRAALIRRQTAMGESMKKIMINRVKDRAAQNNIPFDLEVSDLEIPVTCPVLGITLAVSIGKRGGSPDSPSIDRVVPELGYVRGNVRVISNKANRIKQDATYEEIVAVAEYIKANLRPEKT